MAEEQIHVNNDVDSKLAVITRLQKTTTSNDNTSDPTIYYAPFGVDDKNVQIYNNNTKWGSLRNFFTEWLNFKKIWQNFIHEAVFYQYGSEEPKSNNVKIWFQTPESTDGEQSNN